MSFTVYRSSAGSGKTFTLVREYLSLALNDTQDPPQQYKKILAITFTNKAATEMKERIIRSLKEIAHFEGEEPVMLRELRKKNDFSADVYRERASSVLTAILHNYSEFAVGTIDSFVHRIVRTFAHDLRLPLNFEIETDAQALLTKAVDRIIDLVGEDPKLTEVLIEFTRQKTDEEKSWNIEKDLYKLSGTLLKEDGRKFASQLSEFSAEDFIRLKNHLVKKIRSYEERLLKTGKEGYSLLENCGVPESSFFQGNRGIYNYFRKLAKGNFSDVSPGSYLRKTVDEDKWTSAKATKADAAGIAEISEKLKQLVGKAEELYEAENPEYLLNLAIFSNIYGISVLNEISRALKEIQDEENLIHISEFNRLISEIVMHEPVPFIYERLGTKYHHYMVDEFQDTSLMQWSNLLPLFENALSEGKYTMVVGDGKQAIYRWRGGDVRQFQSLPGDPSRAEDELERGRILSLKRNYSPENLEKNFRSAREIIQFNNELYHSLSKTLEKEYQDIYLDSAQKFNEENSGGYVKISFTEGDHELYVEENLPVLIRQLLNEGYQYSDIAILSRKNKHGNFAASVLLNEGIPVVSPDSLLASASPEVSFLEAFLLWLENEQDEIAAGEIIRFACFKIGENDLLQKMIFNSKKEGLTQTLSSLGFEVNSTSLKNLPLYERTEKIAGTFGLLSGQDAFVIYFLDQVLNFVSKGINTTRDFLKWWEDKKDNASLTVPEETNAVRIMTIHKSKGLEFPVVLMPFANWTNEQRNYIWVNNAEGFEPPVLYVRSGQLKETPLQHEYTSEENKVYLDDLNLMYVATTRPVSRLYMWLGGKRKGTGKLIEHFLNEKGIFDSSVAEYEFGSPVKFSSRHKIPERADERGNWNASDWRNKLKISTTAGSHWDAEDPGGEKEKGILLHRLLSFVESITDIETVAENGYLKGWYEEDEKTDLVKSMRSVVNHPSLSKYFSPGINHVNEGTILVPGGISVRPDRVVENDEETVIIDYKTGSKNKDHFTQVKEYSEYLTLMGYRNVRAILVYFSGREVEIIEKI